MSLGPPFDHSGEKTRLILGGVACVALMFLIGIALLLADRSLGSYVTVRLLVTQPGALHTGARAHAFNPIPDGWVVHQTHPRVVGLVQPAEIHDVGH